MYSSPISSNLDTGAMAEDTQTSRVFETQITRCNHFINIIGITSNTLKYPILLKPESLLVSPSYRELAETRGFKDNLPGHNEP